MDQTYWNMNEWLCSKASTQQKSKVRTLCVLPIKRRLGAIRPSRLPEHHNNPSPLACLTGEQSRTFRTSLSGSHVHFLCFLFQRSKHFRSRQKPYLEILWTKVSLSCLSICLSVCLCLSGSVGDLLYIYRIDGSFVGFPMSAVVLCVWAQTFLSGWSAVPLQGPAHAVFIWQLLVSWHRACQLNKWCYVYPTLFSSSLPKRPDSRTHDRGPSRNGALRQPT